MYLMQM